MSTSPLQAPPSRAITADEFRHAMCRLGSGICVVTSDGPSGRQGFTASAVCSLSDRPPRLIVCIQRASSAYTAVTANGVVCVNVLGKDHENLSRLFGGKTPSHERFSQGRWTALATGAPVLESAPVAFDCHIAKAVEDSTHDVLFCDVAAIHMGAANTGGLVYFGRAYHPLIVPACPLPNAVTPPPRLTP